MCTISHIDIAPKSSSLYLGPHPAACSAPQVPCSPISPHPLLEELQLTLHPGSAACLEGSRAYIYPPKGSGPAGCSGAPQGPHQSSSPPCPAPQLAWESPKPTAQESCRPTPLSCIRNAQPSSAYPQKNSNSPLYVPSKAQVRRLQGARTPTTHPKHKPSPGLQRAVMSSFKPSYNGETGHTAEWWPHGDQRSGLPSGTRSSALRPGCLAPPALPGWGPRLPAHEQTPVVEDWQGNDNQPVVVHVAGGVHHDGVLPGNTVTQTIQCVERPQVWGVLEIWPCFEP